MFLRSAAPDTLQGKAIQAANERWGALNLDKNDFDVYNRRRAHGRKGSSSLYIGAPVCKKKYTPFTVKRTTIKTSASGKVSVQVSVERMYGCKCHSDARRRVIERFGERKGWEQFGQWSLAKAKNAAIKATKDDLIKKKTKIEAERIGSLSPPLIVCNDADGGVNGRKRSSSDLDRACANGGACLVLSQTIEASPEESSTRYDSLCHNGSCLWKTRSKYDDIDDEIQAISDSESSETLLVASSTAKASSSTAVAGRSKRRRVPLARKS